MNLYAFNYHLNTEILAWFCHLHSIFLHLQQQILNFFENFFFWTISIYLYLQEIIPHMKINDIGSYKKRAKEIFVDTLFIIFEYVDEIASAFSLYICRRDFT